MTGVSTLIFDIGGVLVEWDPRYLYEKLVPAGAQLDAFLAEVVTPAWHFQHDAGRPLAETTAELTARFPEHAALIAAWGPRFNESVRGPVAGMPGLLAELGDAGVPLYAITNFSAELWPPFRAAYAALLGGFRDVVVSGDEKLTKPDPAIYARALARFGTEAEAAIFIDDRAENVAAARDIGMTAAQFTDAATLRAELRRLGVPLAAAPRS